MSFEHFLLPPLHLLCVVLYCAPGESVRSIECGIVSTPDYPEILVASYSGKIISFTTEPVLARAAEDSYGRSVLTISNENRIKHMKKEIEDLKKKLKKDREQLQKVSGRQVNLDLQQKPAPEFPVNSKFSLDNRVAAYVLTVELQSSIDLIILRSPVVLDLVETDTGSSVLSVTPPQLLQQCAGGAVSGNDDLGKFVAVFRCQSQEKRIILTLRTNEGEFGDVHITIVADTSPKAAKIIKYDLKPLSLHTKVYSFSKEEQDRPRNVMKYTGTEKKRTHSVDFFYYYFSVFLCSFYTFVCVNIIMYVLVYSICQCLCVYAAVVVCVCCAGIRAARVSAFIVS